MTVDTHTPDVLGAEVYRTNGERIGRAERVYLHHETRKPAWVTVMTGLFGNHESVVPLTNADVSTNRISVPFSKEHIRDSPTVVPVDAHLTTDERRIPERPLRPQLPELTGMMTARPGRVGWPVSTVQITTAPQMTPLVPPVKSGVTQ